MRGASVRERRTSAPARRSRSARLEQRGAAADAASMTTLIRRLGKGYCAAGDGFYCFDEDLSRVLQRVAEFTRRVDPSASAALEEHEGDEPASS
jgi:hypothetical protein